MHHMLFRGPGVGAGMGEAGGFVQQLVQACLAEGTAGIWGTLPCNEHYPILSGAGKRG